jgi:TrmH family RNA methyltransferase
MESEKEENIGRVARVMKNFGYSDLVLINPTCDHLGNKAKALASHAEDILRKARVSDEKILAEFDYVVGTTAILGNDSNVTRIPLIPNDAAKQIAKKKASVGLLFGRESSGLSNEELQKCDVLITVPTAKNYSTMNLSQAVGIVLYEIFCAKGKEHVASHIKMASKKDKEILLTIIHTVLDSIEFSTKGKKETQRKVWKRVVGKSMLSKKEALVLMGFFKKVMRKRG